MKIKYQLKYKNNIYSRSNCLQVFACKKTLTYITRFYVK